MTLYTKCIDHEPSPEDGIRVCVMRWLTHSPTGEREDGKLIVLPREDLYKGKKFDIWWKTVAPPTTVVGAWYGSAQTDEDWSTFREAYYNHLAKKKPRQLANILAQLAMEQDLTLLCVEETHERCHRSILADYCKGLSGGHIKVRHR